jgi:hypothetical protein
MTRAHGKGCGTSSRNAERLPSRLSFKISMSYVAPQWQVFQKPSTGAALVIGIGIEPGMSEELSRVTPRRHPESWFLNLR